MNEATFSDSLQSVREWFSEELGSVRTGRATPAILDTVRVESYGSKLSVKELATVSLEDARTIRVTPWDVNQAKAIEKAVTEKDLGLSVSSDEKGIRLFFPEVTTEQKEKLVKLAKEKLEDARIRVRSAREEYIKAREKEEKAGEISKDELFRDKEAAQKKVDETNKALEEAFERKEKEILST